jgi:hypothetical protein
MCHHLNLIQLAPKLNVLRKTKGMLKLPKMIKKNPGRYCHIRTSMALDTVMEEPCLVTNGSVATQEEKEQHRIGETTEPF